MTDVCNIAAQLAQIAQRMPDALAVIEPKGRNPAGARRYRTVSFRELDQDSDRIARGLLELNVVRGTRLVLMVRPSADFISLVFGIYKAGATVILIDPGMGRRSLIQCLSESHPEGFIAIPLVHAIRSFLRGRFPLSKIHITVGHRWFWGGKTLEQVRGGAWTGPVLTETDPDSPAAIIFTTGSTGAPKGVEFTHRNFAAQVEQIRDFYGIQPGGIDLPCFPMFGLFNCAMGVTAVIPDMDPTRPACVDPKNIIEAVTDWKISQTFGSPAVWNRVGQYCEETGATLPTVRRVLSAGAPVPVYVLERMKKCIHPEGDIHTPYGATEALPVASIAASEVLRETAAQTRDGAGTCVGRRFSKIDWKIIRIVEGPIADLREIEELPPYPTGQIGEIGELIVTGPQVTRRYVTRTEANALAKIHEGERVWHRMGDAGYFDEQERFWFCGRVAHRVLTENGPLYTIPCEAIFNQHPDVFRSALVGIGDAPRQRPVIVIEPKQGKMPSDPASKKKLIDEIRTLGARYAHTKEIGDFLFHPNFPVDIRHNAKIFREKIAAWAAEILK